MTTRMVNVSKEAMRIVRTLELQFPSGPNKTGSAFLAPASGRLLTCAHVVLNDQGERASRVWVSMPGGSRYESTVEKVHEGNDLASLKTSEADAPPVAAATMPEVGEQVVFAGLPQGLAKASVFPGIVSATGTGLLRRPRCELVQIAGMINNGNSGGPVLNEVGELVGVVTAKYVPLLQAIERLTRDLAAIPQFPREVIIGSVDFSKFVNVTIKSMWQLAAVLRLVQVGTGWAVPAKYFSLVGGL